MDLITLNANMQPDKLIEQYDSLIWTERFNTMGEVQIQTGDTKKFMNLLPEGTVVSLRESTVPMIIETHQIVRAKNKPENLIIKGRAFESILDRRAAIKQVIGGSAEWAVVAKIPSDIAHFVINQICVTGVASPLDIFPSSLVEFLAPDDYLDTSGPFRQYTVPRGNLLAQVLTFLQTETRADPATSPPTPIVVPHGIRSRRPNQSGTAVAIQIYRGSDRSEQIRFDGTRDSLDDGSYLFSKVGSATTAYVLGAQTAVVLNADDSEPSGIDRRVILVDGTASGVANEAALVEQGKASLSEAKIIAMFDGSINQDLSPYVYGRDYFLGDTVKLVGDYGLDQKARVTEYIRAEDKTGSKSYPTLVTVDD